MNAETRAQPVRFNHSTLENSPFAAGRRTFLKFRDLGLSAATGNRMRAQLMSADNFEVPPTGWHYHTCTAQLVYMLEGSAEMEFDGGRSPVHFTPGDCSFVPGGIPHNELSASRRILALELSLPSDMGTVACPPDTPNEPANPKMARVFSPAAEASFVADPETGLDCRDLGLARASDGLLSGRVIRAAGAAPRSGWHSHSGELMLRLLLKGWMEIEVASGPIRLDAGDAIVVPGGMAFAERGRSPDFELLEFATPAFAGLSPCESPARS